MISKEHNENMILIKELNSKLRYIFSVYSITKDGLIYGINKGEEETNSPIHCDRFGFIYNEDILNMGELAISSVSLFDILKSFKKTKSFVSISDDNIKIYDNNDTLMGEINYCNDKFINNVMSRYSIINNRNVYVISSLNHNNFYKLSESEIYSIIHNQQVIVPINEFTNVYFDKDMCTDTIKETTNLYIANISELLSYNNCNKELICLREDIDIKKKKENILLASIFSIFAVQKNV